MQEHNALKYSTSLQAAIERLAGVGLEEEGLTRLGETLTPVLNWRDYPEWYSVAERNLCAGFVSVGAGGAGFRSIIVLENSTTNVIGIVRAFQAAPIANLMFAEWVATGLGADSDTGRFLDWRRQNISPPGMVGAGRPRLLIRTRNGVAAPATFGSIMLLRAANGASGDPIIPATVILPPNSAVAVLTDTDNVAIQGGFIWEERQMLVGEPPAFKSAN